MWQNGIIFAIAAVDALTMAIASVCMAKRHICQNGQIPLFFIFFFNLALFLKDLVIYHFLETRFYRNSSRSIHIFPNNDIWPFWPTYCS